MKNFEMLFATVAAVAAASPDGFTFNLQTMQNQVSGCAVAHKETQNSFNNSGLRRVLQYAIANNIPCIGGWLDSETGKYYYDATSIYTSREEATNAAKINDQIAFFDLDLMEEVRL